MESLTEEKSERMRIDELNGLALTGDGLALIM